MAHDQGSSRAGSATQAHQDGKGPLHDGEDVRLRFGDFSGIDREGLFRRREAFFFAALA
jgi:hypothetical protein